MSGFTKGPWRVTTSETNAGTYTIENDAEAFERAESSTAKRCVIARDEPNRRLIEAAPELFRAVEDFLRAHDERGVAPCPCANCDSAQSLINQVKGV
jgi:hypothetical protein